MYFENQGYKEKQRDVVYAFKSSFAGVEREEL